MRVITDEAKFKTLSSRLRTLQTQRCYELNRSTFNPFVNQAEVDVNVSGIDATIDDINRQLDCLVVKVKKEAA